MVDERLDDFVSERAFQQFAQLHTAAQLAVDDMVELSKAAKAAFDGLGKSTKLSDLIGQTQSASAANKGMADSSKIAVDSTILLTNAVKLNTDIIAKNNGHSLEFTKNLKNVAIAQKTATEEAIKLTREQERQDAIQQKLNATNAKQAGAYAALRKEYNDAALAFRNLSAEYVAAQAKGETWSEEQIANLKAAEFNAANLRATLAGINTRIGDNTMNVGNYAQSILEARRLREEMDALAAAGKTDSAEFRDMSGQLGTLTAAMGGTRGQLTWVVGEMQTLAAAGQKDTIEFERLAAVAAELKAEIASVGLSVKEAGAHMETGAVAMEKLTESFKEIGKFALAFFGVQAGMEFIAGISEEFGKADDNARQLTNTLDNMGNKNALAKVNVAVEELETQFKYLDDYEIQNVFDKLLTYGKLSENQIRSLIPVIIDYSAKEKVTIAEGADVFTKALEGNSKALKKYGIDIKEAVGENETAASTGERLNLIMTQLKPRVEGAGQAFQTGWTGKVEGWKKGIREMELAIADFIVKLSGVEEQQFQTAINARKEADSAQALVTEYENLSKKVNQTSEDKDRLNKITTSLTATFGNSVVSIDEETGALTLNLEKTKELIKQKLLLNSQEASKYALQYNEADEKRKENAEQLAKAQIIYNAAVKQYGETIEDIHNKIAYTKSGAIIDNLTPTEKEIVKLHDNVIEYGNELDKYLDKKIEAADKLRERGFKEDDVSKLFNPDVPLNQRPTTEAKKKPEGDNKFKAEQELTKELYSEYAKRLQLSAETQKAISEDETKSMEERLMAYRQYAELAFQAQTEDLSAQYDNIDGSLKQIEKIEKKSVDKREQWEKDLVARKAVLLQQRNNISAQYDLLEQQHIDKTAKGIIAIQQDEVSKRVASIKSLTDNVDIQEGQALKALTDKLKAGTIEYETYTTEKKRIEDKFQKQKYDELVEYLNLEIAALSAHGVDTAKLQEQLNAALKHLYDADVQNAENAAKKKSDLSKELANKEWELASQFVSTAKSLWDGYYQSQLDKEQSLLDAIETRKNAEQDAINLAMESADDKAKQTQALNEQVAAQEKKISNEQRRIKREQAIADRVAALLGVVEGVAKAEAANAINFANPLTAAYGAEIAQVIAGIGILEAATILAQPLPQYGGGTPKDAIGHPGGFAVIGDKPEWVFEPGKEPYFTSATHVANLQRGTRVIPETDMIAGSMGFLTPALLQGLNVAGNNDYAGLENTLKQEMGSLRESIQNIPINSYSFNNGELVKVVRRGSSKTTFINKHFS